MYPEITETFVNLRTDFGFKHIFGKEANKDLLIDFINALLRGQRHVVDLSYLPTEQLPGNRAERNAVFDLYCLGQNGERFIVEMQNSYQKSFKARSIYYSTFPIQQGVEKGRRDYTFPPVYSICLLNFVFNEPGDQPFDDRYISRVKLVNIDTERVFYDDLTYIYVELPKFGKGLKQLDSDLDRWMFVLRNLSDLLERPTALQSRVFKKLFEQAQVATLSKGELMAYKADRNAFRDLKGMLSAAEDKGHKKGMEEGLERGMEKGMEKGREEGKKEIARSLRARGMDAQTIATVTGLAVSEIEGL